MEDGRPLHCKCLRNSSAQRKLSREKASLSKHLQEQPAQAPGSSSSCPPPPTWLSSSSPARAPPALRVGSKHPAVQLSMNVIRGKTQEARSKQKSLDTCCHPAASRGPRLHPAVLLEERAHSGLWLVVLEPSSSNMAKREGSQDERRQDPLGSLGAESQANTHSAAAWLCGPQPQSDHLEAGLLRAVTPYSVLRGWNDSALNHTTQRSTLGFQKLCAHPRPGAFPGSHLTFTHVPPSSSQSISKNDNGLLHSDG